MAKRVPTDTHMDHMIRTLLHVHTDYSHDSDASLRDVVAAARRERIDCVSITDHDDIRAALALRRGGEIRVIVGEEISTAQGHLIGLFLHEHIRPGLPATTTARLIHEQGGVVLAPHPYSTLCDSSLRRACELVAGQLDAVEVFNAQNPLPWQDGRAARFAARHGLPGYVGGDSHLRDWPMAPCYQIMPDFSDGASFLAALRQATFVRRRHPLGYLVRSAWGILSSKLIGRRPAAFGANCLPENRSGARQGRAAEGCVDGIAEAGDVCGAVVGDASEPDRM